MRTMGRSAWLACMRMLSHLGVALVATVAVLKADVWVVDGEKVEGRLAALYGPMAMIAQSTGSQWIPVAKLDDASLLRLRDARAALAAPSPLWEAGSGKVTRSLKGKLQVWDGRKLVKFEPVTQKEPKFYMTYFGAHWCPPCRKFSPRLLTAYKDLKAKYGDSVELVFISSDNDAAEQRKYIQEVGMPWPVLKYSSLGSAKPLEQWAARGIPNLVVTTSDGDLLFHSYNGNDYIGPSEVLEKFTGFLRFIQSDESAETKRAYHRMAVLQHVSDAKGGDVPIKPYLIGLRPEDGKGLDVKTVMFSLTIGERGEVLSSETLTPLGAVDRASLIKASYDWLFLPEVKEGVPRERSVKLPLSF